ncbi:RagB/SusD family nutrient uptake outer membrane protein [uncultured Polaribacter sp.]|uniref:RagB/SusD family nutrient uptake outer membrane protein n=1 Tax=uncultured Polaribacter sp. TaxID=174711 RepID=UPI002629D1AF|nr:RagB/SusD family nutrient uptake outer membrane protein [uncultured Polaribacter sp.]
MKKYILLILVLVITVTSCDNRLDTFPTSTVAAEEAFRNEGDFTNAIRGAYLRMLTGAYYNGSMQSRDVLSDNLIISREGRLSQQQTHDWLYNQNSGSYHTTSAYAVIRNVNNVLQNLGTLENGSFKNNIQGEALAIRALAHFDVIKFYGEIPTQAAGSNATLAMPYIETSDINDLPARTLTIAEFYQKIVTDLTTAAALINADNGVYQMGKNAVNGILANVYLHMGEMANAVTAANKVTASVASRANFTGVWNDSSKDGVIFGLRNDDVTSVGVGVPYSQTTGGIKSEYVPDFEFYSLYQANDIRLSAYFETSDFEGNSYNHVLKWYASTIATSTGNVDAKIVRASEVMLIKAEALAAQGGKDAEALAALDAVRSQRYEGFTSGNEAGPALRDAIQLERRLELAFEGSRFTDIKRMGLPVERSNKGHLADGSGVAADVLTLPAGDHRFNLPISLNELNLNPNMVQSPGYGN